MLIRLLTPTLSSLFLLLTLISSLAPAHATTTIVPADEFETSTLPHTLPLYLSPLTSSSTAPAAYGTISYNPSTLQAQFTPSSTPPLKHLPASAPLAKLGLYDEGTRRWGSAVVVQREVLEKGGCIVLYLGERGAEVKYVGFTEAGEAVGGGLVKVVRAAPGPIPVLNRPVVVDEDGKVPEPEVEKTFFQKYWWIFLAAFMLIITSGGADDGK